MLLMKPFNALENFFSNDFFNTDWVTSIADPKRWLTTNEDGNYLVSILAPSREKKDFDVKLKGRRVTVKSELDQKNGNSVFASSIIECFDLPDDADEHSIEAKYKGGVLTITIGKKETPVIDPDVVDIEVQ